mgnify:FL=1
MKPLFLSRSKGIEYFKHQTVMVRKVMGRRHDRIDIYAPKGEVNETGWASGLWQQYTQVSRRTGWDETGCVNPTPGHLP